MNSRDLTLSAIEGTPEKVPFNPFIMHLAATIEGINYSQVYCRDAEALVEAHMSCAKTFGIDHVNVSTDAYREASAWGVEVDFSGHTPVPSKTLRFESFDSLETPDLSVNERVQNRVQAVKLLNIKVGREQCIVGWIEAPFAEICCLFGLMEVLKLGWKPDWKNWVKALMERVLPVQLEFAKMQIEAGADIIGAGDSAVSQIGPKRYEEACLEKTQELFRSIGRQVPVLYHVCGDTSALDKEGRDMLKLLSRSGASILDIDYQVNMAVAKSKIGNQICLRGNTNTSLLGNRLYGSEDVAREVTQTIEAGKPDGRYMFGAGCEWPWEPLDVAARNLGIAKTLNDRLGVY
ncbi:MAG: uroporphyrinogen decarboxylase family protein [Promethearchaeati archaeon SRVP18_Atabeyarchaeia-1]